MDSKSAEIAKDIFATPTQTGVIIEVGNDVGYIPTFLPMMSLEDAEAWVLERWCERNRCLTKQ